MIYDCPQCQTPQPPGVVHCAHCGVEFDGPVPDDATVPEGSPSPLLDTPPLLAAEPPATGLQADEPPLATAPLVEDLPPPISEAPPAYEAPPVYAPPPYMPSYTPAAPAYPSAQALPAPVKQGLSPVTVLLIVVPLALLLIGGTIFAVSQLNNAPVATTTASNTPNAPSLAPAAPTGPPTYLAPGSEVSAAHVQFDPANRWLVGRWVNPKTSNYYVFKDNGTGYRGTLAGSDNQETFLWQIVQKQLVLYPENQSSSEKVTFSEGPDDNTLFLRAADGKRYSTFTRTGDNG